MRASCKIAGTVGRRQHHASCSSLYDVIRQRYERGSLVLTSNRDVSELYGLFGDELLASAAMDRLLHHAHVLRLQGNSYRTPGSVR